MLGLAVLAGLWVLVAPLVFDHVYYTGPKSNHFDGQHFFNPDGDDVNPATPGTIPLDLLWSILTGRGRPAWPDHIHVMPSKPAPHVDGARLVTTWVGHATVLVQTEGLNILTDPNWAETVGPFGLGPHRAAEPGVNFDDLPHIDVVLISHDHYDHLDLPTLKRLDARDHPRIFAGLGVDRLLAANGISAHAMDWGQRASITANMDIIATRSHHWSSRWSYDARRTLWTAFVITTPHGNIFFAGDTGPGDMKWPFEAASYGPVRLALLPIGAFRFSPGQMASRDHIGPRDAMTAFQLLNAEYAIPIHWGTWHLSTEGYDTPSKMLAAERDCRGIEQKRFSAVRVGEAVDVPSAYANAVNRATVDDNPNDIIITATRVSNCPTSKVLAELP